MQGLRQLSAALRSGELSATGLVQTALKRAHDSANVFISINDGVESLARSIDQGAPADGTASPLAGIPIALKDLFNLRNEKTLAGSRVRRHYAGFEAEDAAVVAPLRAAGLLFLGRVNMSEFAYSGIGTNAHYGTPQSIWDRATGRLPGGSSSGSAVAVAEGIVAAALGSDTAGSCRIPAAFNGVVGVKPSYGRMSLEGIYPLSPTLDAPGPIAVDVDSCFILDQLMCGELSPTAPLPELEALSADTLSFVIPEADLLAQLDPEVSQAFDRAVAWLRDTGIRIETAAMPVIDRCDRMFVERPLVVREVWDHHREMLERYPQEYDPFVGVRLRSGADISDDEQAQRHADRAALVHEFEQAFNQLGATALLYPTVACIPPAISETADAENARQVNLRCLRNTATVNYFDGCAMSLPCQVGEEAPVGLMLSAANGQDATLYRAAATVEAILSTRRA